MTKRAQRAIATPSSAAMLKIAIISHVQFSWRVMVERLILDKNLTRSEYAFPHIR
jgi:hypothetical protein